MYEVNRDVQENWWAVLYYFQIYPLPISSSYIIFCSNKKTEADGAGELVSSFVLRIPMKEKRKKKQKAKENVTPSSQNPERERIIERDLCAIG